MRKHYIALDRTSYTDIEMDIESMRKHLIAMVSEMIELETKALNRRGAWEENSLTNVGIQQAIEHRLDGLGACISGTPKHAGLLDTSAKELKAFISNHKSPLHTVNLLAKRFSKNYNDQLRSASKNTLEGGITGYSSGEEATSDYNEMVSYQETSLINCLKTEMIFQECKALCTSPLERDFFDMYYIQKKDMKACLKILAPQYKRLGKLSYQKIRTLKNRIAGRMKAKEFQKELSRKIAIYSDRAESFEIHRYYKHAGKGVCKGLASVTAIKPKDSKILTTQKKAPTKHKGQASKRKVLVEKAPLKQNYQEQAPLDIDTLHAGSMFFDSLQQKKVLWDKGAFELVPSQYRMPSLKEIRAKRTLLNKELKELIEKESQELLTPKEQERILTISSKIKAYSKALKKDDMAIDLDHSGLFLDSQESESDYFIDLQAKRKNLGKIDTKAYTKKHCLVGYEKAREPKELAYHDYVFEVIDSKGQEQIIRVPSKHREPSKIEYRESQQEQIKELYKKEYQENQARK